MQPDQAAIRASERSLELWQDLAEAYGEIELALVSGRPEAVTIKCLTTRIMTLERELLGLLGPIAVWRSDPSAGEELTGLWASTDQIIADLSKRHPALVRAAVVARDGVGEELLRVGERRRTAAAYGRGSRRSALASRVV